MVGLKVYKVKDKETYNHLHTVLTGWVFFRNEGDDFYIKAPKNKSIETLIEMGSITELNQMKIEV
jgi:hypothetical protein